MKLIIDISLLTNFIACFKLHFWSNTLYLNGLKHCDITILGMFESMKLPRIS